MGNYYVNIGVSQAPESEASSGEYKISIGPYQGIKRTYTSRPYILRQTKSQTVIRNTNLTLSVLPYGSGLSFSWYKDSEQIEGNSETISITVNNDSIGSYVCRVTNSNGYVESNPIKIGLFEPKNYFINVGVSHNKEQEESYRVSIGAYHGDLHESAQTPAILKQSRSTFAYLNSNILFSVKAIGAPVLSYQWYFNNEILEGKTEKTLDFTVNDYSSGIYVCRIWNSIGEIFSDPIILYVLDFGSYFINIGTDQSYRPLGYYHINMGAYQGPLVGGVPCTRILFNVPADLKYRS